MDSGGDGSGPSQPGRGLNLVLVVLLELLGMYAGLSSDVSPVPGSQPPVKTRTQYLLRQAAGFLRSMNWREALRVRRILNNIGLAYRLLMLLALLPLLIVFSNLLQDATDRTYVTFETLIAPSLPVMQWPLGVCILLAASAMARRVLTGWTQLRLRHVLARPQIYERWLDSLVRGPEFYAELPRSDTWVHKLLGLRVLPRTLQPATRFLLREVDWLGRNPVLRDSRLLLISGAVSLSSVVMSAVVVLTTLKLLANLITDGYCYPAYFSYFTICILYIIMETGITFLAWRYEPWFSGNWRDRVLYIYLLEHLTAQLRDDA